MGWILVVLCLVPVADFGPLHRTWQAPVQLAAVDQENRMSVSSAQTDAGAEAMYVDENLLRQAKTHGSVRVVVRLKLDDWQPASEVSQQQAIARLQEKLLHSMASFVVSNVRQFRFVPQMALTVDEAGVKALMSHPDVSAIWADMPVAPGQ